MNIIIQNSNLNLTHQPKVIIFKMGAFLSRNKKVDDDQEEEDPGLTPDELIDLEKDEELVREKVGEVINGKLEPIFTTIQKLEKVTDL